MSDPKNYPIVGTNFCEGGLQVVASLKDGDSLALIREPTNKHDANAIAVYAGTSKIGYIARQKNLALAQFIDQSGEPAMALDGNPKSARATFIRSPNSGYPMLRVSE